MINEITQAYVIEWDGGGDYVCRNCASELEKGDK